MRDLQQYAFQPLKQKSNRVWRTYEGGALIDRWKRADVEEDNSLPEEWIMSTITARGKNRPKEEGLSKINTAFGEKSLKELRTLEFIGNEIIIDELKILGKIDE